MKMVVQPALAIAALIYCLFSPGRTVAAEAAPSAAQWRATAIAAIGAVEDDALRSQLQYEAVYVLVRAGELDEARAAAAGVTSPQQRIYAHTQVAKGHRAAGNVEAALGVLNACRKSVLDASADQREDWIGYMIQAYAEAGFIDEARELAGEMKLDWQRENVLQDIARSMAEAGDLDGARALLEELGTKKKTQSGLALLVASLASSQKTEEALAAAEGLETAERADVGFINLAQELLRANRLDEAAEAAARIKAIRVRETVQGRIAAAAMAGDDAAAIEARIAAAATRETKLPLFELLVKKLAAAGRIAAADAAIESMVAEIEASPRRFGVVAFEVVDDQWAIAAARSLHLEISKALAKSGELEAARQHLAQAKEAIVGVPDEAGVVKSAQLMKLVTAYIEAGDLKEAGQLIEQLPETFAKSMAMQQLALAFIQAEDFAPAVRTSRQITYEAGRGHAVGRVAGALIRSGEIDEAKSVLDGLSETADDLNAYREVGEVMAAEGQEAKLLAWLPDTPSAAARAYACLGAAEKRVGPAQQLAPGQ